MNDSGYKIFYFDAFFPHYVFRQCLSIARKMHHKKRVRFIESLFDLPVYILVIRYL